MTAEQRAQSSEQRADSYVAIHRHCQGMLAAVFVNEDHPERWAKVVGCWARWRNIPEIRFTTVEAVREMRFCRCTPAERRSEP